MRTRLSLAQDLASHVQCIASGKRLLCENCQQPLASIERHPKINLAWVVRSTSTYFYNF